MTMDLLTPPVEITSRMHEIAKLERRLEDGFARIEDAKRDGIDTSDWEEFWAKLLLQYQALSDELAEAA